jgi:hypothetical protein
MIFNILKATEGGMGQKQALQLLKEAGIKASLMVSGYLGYTAVTIKRPQTNKRVIKATERILYGRY